MEEDVFHQYGYYCVLYRTCNLWYVGINPTKGEELWRHLRLIN